MGPPDPQSVGFSQTRFDTLSEISEKHFWFAARRAIVARMLQPLETQPLGLALDVGCGPGIWLRDWNKYARRVVGIDPFEAPDTAESPLPGAERVIGTADALPAQDQTVDLVICQDVLEHVDDVSALTEVSRVLRAGGYVMITVPAGPWLWSHRDVAANHLRRYTKATLSAKVKDAGFDIVDCRFFPSLLFPIVATTRLLGRRKPKWRDREDRLPNWLNAVFMKITMFEIWLGLRLPFGSSLALLAQRKA